MSRKIIELEHKVCDYTCMWNGIEDLYQRKTENIVPDYFFFCLSKIGNFVYLSLKKGSPKRMHPGMMEERNICINQIQEIS